MVLGQTCPYRISTMLYETGPRKLLSNYVFCLSSSMKLAPVGLFSLNKGIGVNNTQKKENVTMGH